MSELQPDEGREAARAALPSRRKALTPAQRRLLGTPRALQKEPPRAEAPVETRARPISPDDGDTSSAHPAPASETAATPEPSSKQRAPAHPGETKAARRIEMQHAFLILGVLLLLFAIFWAGRKFDRVQDLIKSRLNTNELEAGPEKFPGLTSEELVEGALAAEREGDWQGAAQRFIAAKRKDLHYQGILFRIGKTSFDRGDWEGADQALEHALRFGENIAVANHLRGLIAVRRHHLPAAERYFEAAAKAEPFVADFFYFWGETLRLDQHPREAIRRYQQAVHRTPSATDATLCQFKIRLARMEAAEVGAVALEVEAARQAGPLSVDWLMTDAALQLRAGKIKESAQLISQARATGPAGLFATCAGDTIFLKASETHPEIASVVHVTPPAR